MGLEAGSYIEDLVVTNPTASDARSEGDDHIRLVKATLKATFPGMLGAMNRVVSKSSNFAIAATDRTAVFVGTATITATLGAAATLGNGFTCTLVAGANQMTITPFGTETVDGASTYVVRPYTSVRLWCDGTAFYVEGFASQAEAEAGTDTNKWMTPESFKWAFDYRFFPAGTRLMFQQTTPPTGWTKDSTAAFNDSLLRLVTGTTTSGGSQAFSTWNALTATGAHTLTIAEMPAHTHSSVVGSGIGGDGSGGADRVLAGSTGSQGGGGSHTHPLTNGLKFCDLVIGVKD